MVADPTSEEAPDPELIAAPDRTVVVDNIGAEGIAMLELEELGAFVVVFESCAEAEEVEAAAGCTGVGASMVAVAGFCGVGRRIRRWGFFVVVAELFFSTVFPSTGRASDFVWGVLSALDGEVPLSAAAADWG